MTSTQCQRPVDHTKKTTPHSHATVDHTKTGQHAQNKCNNTCSCCHRKGNEQSFTNKMKEMANSAYKKVADQMHQHHHDQPNTGPKPASPKQKESGMSNCIPRIGDHKKKGKNSRKKKGNDCECKDDNSSSSDSENESNDNNAHVKRI
ncbi:hypothetical protein Hanom_Chr06g00482851 [Helianthus anomalus]